MIASFVSRCTYRLNGSDYIGMHFEFAEYSDLPDETPDVTDVMFARRDRTEEVAMTLRAVDEDAALARAEAILGEIENAIRERFGSDAIERGPLEIRAADAMSEGWMEQVTGLLDPSMIQDLLAPTGDEESSTPLDGPRIDDPYRAMRESRTNGDNYGVGTEDIIEWFERWERHADFHFVAIGGAHLTVVFDQLPDDVDAFVAEACILCPDLDNNITEMADFDYADEDVAAALTLQGVAKNLQRDRTLQFWWD